MMTTIAFAVVMLIGVPIGLCLCIAGVAKGVRALASVIAEIMAEFHGVPFRVHIDHEDGFVVVRPK